MAAKTGSRRSPADRPKPGDGVYLDSSALVKLYLPEKESETLDRFLVGRRDLVISELSITEVISALARGRREGVLDSEQVERIYESVLADARSGSFRLLDISPVIHRSAERILLASESTPLRTLDAVHIALAVFSGVKFLSTFDIRMSEAALRLGLKVLKF
jgi:uncharacterized protein